MEREKSEYLSTPLENCWFGEFCRDLDISCNICQDKGLHYITKKIYMPKTLIPLSYQFSEIGHINFMDEAAEAKRYGREVYSLASQGKGYYAYSRKTGTGKTLLGCYALRKFLYHSLLQDPYDIDNRRAVYINTSLFLDRIRKSFNNEDIELDQLYEELTNITTAPKLVLFDDIGAEKPSEWVRERLYVLIEFRVSNGLANIFTGNCDIIDLVKKVGNRVTSRVSGSGRILHFPEGTDYRGCSW